MEAGEAEPFASGKCEESAMNEKHCRRKAAHPAQGSNLRRAFQAGLEGLRLESGLGRRKFAEQLGIP